MSKKGNSSLIAIVVIIVIAAVVAGYYFLTNASQPESDLPTPSAAMNDTIKEEDKMERDDSMAEETTMQTTGAKYVMYDKAGYEQIKDQRHVLFFYANWCPTCKPADKEFQAKTSQIPNDITLVRVNYNDSQTDSDEEALADEYGITYQHTFVLLENGQVVKKWNGGGLSELLTQIR